MLKLGVEHILTGADHLVFLLGLILVGGGLRVARGRGDRLHRSRTRSRWRSPRSRCFAPSPRFVEPAIALSIAYVGVENLFVKDARRRWRITFPFGLIHGFGFAGALREIALPRAQVPDRAASRSTWASRSGSSPCSRSRCPSRSPARRAPWFGDRGVKALSVAIAVAGGVLFIVRLAAR